MTFIQARLFWSKFNRRILVIQNLLLMRETSITSEQVLHLLGSVPAPLRSIILHFFLLLSLIHLLSSINLLSLYTDLPTLTHCIIYYLSFILISVYSLCLSITYSCIHPLTHLCSLLLPIWSLAICLAQILIISLLFTADHLKLLICIDGIPFKNCSDAPHSPPPHLFIQKTNFEKLSPILGKIQRCASDVKAALAKSPGVTS